MIDISETVLECVAKAVGRAYWSYPQTPPTLPYATVDQTGRLVELCDADGSEIIVRCTYSIVVYAERPSQARAMAEAVSDALAPYCLHATGWSSVYEEATNRLYRVNCVFEGAVDRRGATYD